MVDTCRKTSNFQKNVELVEKDVANRRKRRNCRNMLKIVENVGIVETCWNFSKNVAIVEKRRTNVEMIDIRQKSVEITENTSNLPKHVANRRTTLKLSKLKIVLKKRRKLS